MFVLANDFQPRWDLPAVVFVFLGVGATWQEKSELRVVTGVKTLDMPCFSELRMIGGSLAFLSRRKSINEPLGGDFFLVGLEGRGVAFSDTHICNYMYIYIYYTRFYSSQPSKCEPRSSAFHLISWGSFIGPQDLDWTYRCLKMMVILTGTVHVQNEK